MQSGCEKEADISNELLMGCGRDTRRQGAFPAKVLTPFTTPRTSIIAPMLHVPFHVAVTQKK